MTRAYRILAADDNEVNRKILSMQITRLGFVMDLVSSGDEAVAAFRNGTYRLVFMDVNMDRMDGYTATRTIRSQETGLRTPIVAITANPDLREQERCLDAGMDDLLGKPITLGELTRHLIRWGACRSVPDGGGDTTERAPIAEVALARLHELERACGQDGLAKELIAEFTERVPARLRRLGKALERGQIDKLKRECFALQMHSLGMGAARLERIVAHLGQAAKSAELTELVQQAEREYAAVAAELGSST
jgi:CheY-like chemotaxis protein